MFIQLLINSLSLGSIYALIALGFAIIYRASGVVNFAQGEMMMIAAVIALVLHRHWHLAYWLVFLLCVLTCTAGGMLIERISFRPLRHAPHFTVLLSTVATAQILRSGVRTFYGQEVSSFPPAFSIQPIQIGQWYVTPLSLAIICITLLTLVVFQLMFSHTKIGWAMRAAAQNMRGASIVGISGAAVQAQTWAIAGALAAVAGFLIAPLVIITPDMGVIGNKGLIAAIIGGFTSLPGAVIGGFLLAIAENFIGVYMSNAFKDVIVFFLMVLLLFVRPSGLFGKKTVSRV